MSARADSSAAGVATCGGGNPLPGALSIATARLELRRLCSEDAALYRDLYTDPQTMRFIAPPLTARQAARSFATALRVSDAPLNGPLFLSIIERTSQLSLGLCAIQQIRMRRAETGVIICAAARGRGFATEALRGVIGWGLACLPLEHLWVSCALHNLAAERLVHAAGLIRQAGPAAAQSDPAAQPEVIWSIDRESWQRKQPKQEKNDVERARVS